MRNAGEHTDRPCSGPGAVPMGRGIRSAVLVGPGGHRVGS